MPWDQVTSFETINTPDDIRFDTSNTYYGIGTSDGLEIRSRADHSLTTTLTGGGRTLAFDPNETIVASCESSTAEVRIFEYDTWTQYTNATIGARVSAYCQIHISRDGQYLASVNGNMETEIHEIGGDTTWTLAQTLTEPGADTRTLCWHPDGWLLLTDRNGNLWLVDQSTLSVVDTLASANTPISDAYRSDYHPTQPWFVVASGSDSHAVFDVSGGTITVEQSWTSGTGALSVAMSENWLYRSDGTSGDELLYETGTWTLDNTLAHAFTVYGSQFSTDEELLAFGNRDTNVGPVYIYSTPTLTTPVTGKFTVDGTATSGATARGINDTQGRHEGTDTTDTNGDYSIAFPIGDVGHFMIEYEDPNTGEMVTTESKPFVAVE